MNNRWNSFKAQISRWMYGRYGADELSMAMHIAVFICLVLSFIPFFAFLSFIGALLLIADIFRTFSRNIAARRRELQWYLRIKKKCTDQFYLRKKIWQERNTHCYFHCPHCRAMLRVPKNRGEITVTCPKCGTKTDKKT